MARRGNGNTATLDSDLPVDAQADDEDREDVAGQAVEPEPEVVDLNGFKAAVTALDKESPDYTAVKAEYDVLSRKGKMQSSAWIRASLFDAVEAENYEEARALSKVKKYFASLTPATSTEAVDPTVELVNRIAAFRIVASQLAEGQEALEDQIAKAVESPNEKVQAAVAKLVEIRAARKPRGPGGTRHSVANHIIQVFENVASGEFLDSKAIGLATSEEYGGPSTPSAVKSKLESGKFSHDGLVVETVGDVIGVRKS